MVFSPSVWFKHLWTKSSNSMRQSRSVLLQVVYARHSATAVTKKLPCPPASHALFWHPSATLGIKMKEQESKRK
jgi:hypothetical protein